jgi:hypothetical protein
MAGLIKRQIICGNTANAATGRTVLEMEMVWEIALPMLPLVEAAVVKPIET